MSHPTDECIAPELFASVFQSLHVPIVVVDYETRRVVAFNRAFITESGYTAEQLIGQETKNVTLFPSEASRDQIYAKLAEQKQLTTTLMVSDPNGTVSDLTLHMSLAEVGGRRYLVSCAEPTAMVDTPNKCEQQLQGIVDMLPGVIFQYGYDAEGRGRFTYLSDKTEALFSLLARNIVLDVSCFWEHVSYRYRYIARDSFAVAVVNHRPWELEFPFRHRHTDEERWFHCIAFPKSMSNGEALWTGFVSDITQLHQLEEAQQAAQMLLQEERLQKSKLESLGTLAGGIAHDINNLLAVLTGNLGLLKRSAVLEEENRSRLESIERATERAKLLAKQLLTFSKGGVLESVSPEVFVVEPMRYILESRGVDVTFDISTPLWQVQGDVGQLNQVFQNLAANAADAMPKGGQVRVSLQNCTLGHRDVPSLAAGDYVHISVTDTSSRIAPEYLPQIFDPYFTTKADGHGLGLAIAYGVLSKHHGHIAVTSTVGVGTRFDIYLPAEKSQKTTQKSAALTTGEAGQIANRRLLIMDDDELVREMLKAALETFGYSIVSCQTGEEAIEHYRLAMASGRPFLGVMLDLQIGCGLGGQETLEHLQKLDPHVTAIVCSGYHDDSIIASYHAYGFKAKLPKPFDSE
ncbi:MAG: ATP-binding protein [Acidobacteriota bacterium]